MTRDLPLRLVSLVPLVHRRDEGRPEPDARGDGQHGVEAREHGAVEHHLAQPRVHWQLGEVVAQRRELVARVDGVQFRERSERGRDGTLGRGLDGLRQKLPDVSQTKDLDLQAQRVQRRSKNLRRGEIGEFRLPGARVEVEAVPLADATSAAPALPTARAAAPRGDQGRHSR